MIGENVMEHSVERANRYLQEQAPEINPQFRTGFHAMPPVGWINDPNGLCYYRGQYHLFCQYYPYDAKWGPMHWGHWTSPDLLQWKWVGVALAPDTPADCNGVFSGHAIVEGDTLIAMYTGVSLTPEGEERQQQCIARSTDGIHFVKDPNNPVISTADLPEGSDPRNFRDPKLFKAKNEDGYRAVMASRDKTGGRLLVYCSTDLTHWSLGGIFASGVGEMLECPDYHTIDGQDVLISCVMNMPQDGYRFPHTNPVTYLLGRTDEKQTSFAIDTFEALDCGPNFYAPQAVDGPDGCVLIGWMPGWGIDFPTQYLHHNWCGHASFPRVLHIHNNKVYQEPIPALSNLRKNPRTIDARLSSGEKITGKHTKCTEFCFNIRSDAPFELSIFNDAEKQNGFLIGYNPSKHLLRMNRNTCGYPTAQKNGVPDITCAQLTDVGQTLNLHIILDTCTVELFANHGEKAMSACVYPEGQSPWYWSFTAQSNCDVQGEIYDLKSASEISC